MIKIYQDESVGQPRISRILGKSNNQIIDIYSTQTGIIATQGLERGRLLIAGEITVPDTEEILDINFIPDFSDYITSLNTSGIPLISVRVIQFSFNNIEYMTYEFGSHWGYELQGGFSEEYGLPEKATVIYEAYHPLIFAWAPSDPPPLKVRIKARTGGGKFGVAMWGDYEDEIIED